MLTILGSLIVLIFLAVLIWAWHTESTPDLDMSRIDRDEPAWTYARPAPAPEREARAWAARAGMRLGSAPLSIALARARAATMAGVSREAVRWSLAQWYPAWHPDAVRKWG